MFSRLVVLTQGVEGREEDVPEPDLRGACDIPEREPGDVDRPAVGGEVQIGFGERVRPVVLDRPELPRPFAGGVGRVLDENDVELADASGELAVAEPGDVDVAGTVQLDRGTLVVQGRPDLVLQVRAPEASNRATTRSLSPASGPSKSPAE